MKLFLSTQGTVSAMHKMIFYGGIKLYQMFDWKEELPTLDVTEESGRGE